MRLILDRVLLRAEVVATRTIRPRLREITLRADNSRNLDWTPGQHVRVFFRAPRWLPDAVRAPSREYTIWNCLPDGTMQLRVFLHGNGGPGNRWAQCAAKGDQLAITKPEGHLVPADADYHVLVGEDTAAVAFGAILRALPSTAQVRAIIEVDSTRDIPQIPRPRDITWVYRDGESAVASARVVDAMRELALPAGRGAAYIAGESRTCQLARQVLIREHSWDRGSIKTTAFWTAGRSGH